jgi:hypothetical protein
MLLDQKDMDYQQEVDHIKVLFEEQNVESEKTNVKLTRKLRDSGQQYVELKQEIRQIQTEIQGMKFADCTLGIWL